MTAPDLTGPALDEWLDAHREELIAFRRQLHMFPERSGEEHATTELIAERLRVAGLTSQVLSCGTGLVCDLGAAPTIALRADIDALAMQDVKAVSYRSQHDGVAHACGHDVHTTASLGAGLFLANHAPELAVRLVFQPAEERVPGGALDAIGDGALDGVARVFGLHCDPKLDLGQVGLRVGAITSAADMAVVELFGPGGHTARPERTVDMVALAARVVTELPDRVRRRLGPDAPVRLVFGAIHAGDAPNVIPVHAELRGSIRTPLIELWDALPAAIDAELHDLVDAAGATCELRYTRGVPPVTNDATAVEEVRRGVARVLGGDAITEAVQSWGGDDFAWYTRQVPSAYVRLGTHDPTDAGPRHDLHAGHFDVDERAIGVGVRVLVASIEQHLAAAVPMAPSPGT